MTAVWLALCLTAPAWSLHPASKAEANDIEILINDAKIEEKALRSWMDKRRASSGRVPSPALEQDLETEIDADPIMRAHKDKRDLLINAATRMTLKAYGMLPVDGQGAVVLPSGPVHDPNLKAYGRETATWSISFQRPPPRVHTLAKGKSFFGWKWKDLVGDVTEAEREAYSGITFTDGTSFIWPDVGDLNSAKLARLVHHELNHHLINITPGEGDKLGFYGKEAEVLRRDIAGLQDFGFAPTELELEKGKLKYRKHEAELMIPNDATVGKFSRFLERWKSRVRGAPDENVAVIDSSIPGLKISEEELAAIRKRGDELADRADLQSKERMLMEVARETCESTRRLRYDDVFQAKYRRVPAVFGEPRILTSDPCAQEVFARLWRAKAQDLRNADWHAIADAAESLGGSSGGGSGYVYQCTPSPGMPCPTLSRPAAAVVPVSPAPAVAATLPVPAQPAFSPSAALNLMAAKGCADPWAFSQSDLDWYWGRLSGTAFQSEAAGQWGLAGCQYSLFMRLMQMASERSPERLTREIFAQAAAAARGPAEVEMTDVPDDRPSRGPVVPTCRHHPWCQKWGN